MSDRPASTDRLSAPTRVLSRRARRGMSIIEIMIVVAILVGLLIVAVPITSSLLRIEKRQTVAQLGTIYRRLQNEAMLRNMTFRIAYHLEDRYYEVEGSTDQALLFATPEARIANEAALAEALRRKPKRRRSSEEDDGVGFEVDKEGLSLKQAQFQSVQDKFLRRFDLPPGIRFGGVYTPAHGEFVTPSREDPERMKDEDKNVIYSYILPSGVSEHAVIQFVNENNHRRGYTVEVEPATGRVNITDTLEDWDRRFSFVPTRGPNLP